MKWVVGCFMLVSVVVGSCQKEQLDSDVRISSRSIDEIVMRPGTPLRPDTMCRPVFPKLPRLSLREPVLLSPCIFSYDDLVRVLGTNKVSAKAVVLDGGVLGDITLERSVDLPWIGYTAVAGATGSSLFQSQLQVEWRPDPSVYFTGFSADVWSAGCVYDNPALGPFTNLIKDGAEIRINTCFFWGVGEYAHLRIKYLVLE